MILERIIFTGTVVRSGNSSNEKIMSTRELGRRNHSLPGFLLLTFLMSNASAPAFVLCSLHVDAVPAAAQDEGAVPIFFSKSSSSCAAQIVSAKGGIKGRVLDEEIKSPIAGVTVKVAGTLFSAVTDVAGNFAISAVPVGGYSLEFTCQYYHSRIQTDVIVKSEHITTVEVEMKLSIDAKRREEVTVRAGYFTVSEQQPLSRAGFSYEEIRRAAGAEGDISRIVAARKFAAFVNHTWNPVPRLGVSLGVRADYFSYNESLHVSPRFSLSLELTKKMSIEAAAGLITQSLPMAIVLRSSAPRNLKDPQAWHFVLGLRRILTDNTLLTVEVYDKEYRSLPLDPAQPYLSILDESSYSCFLGGHERLIAMGWGRSCGVEVMVQKKLADKVYGIVSGSYFRSRYRDLEGTWRDRAYDCRYILSIEGGWKPNRFWEFSLKWNYAGGNPYTPFDIETSRATNTGIFDLTKINAERLPAYHALNLRADKRFYFRRSNLILYLSIWNVFDRKNAVTYYWNTLERKPGMVRQFGIVPALGVEFEF